MRNDNDSPKLMVGLEMALEDVASWSDPGGNLQVVQAPGRGSKIRIPVFVFKARMNRIRPRNHARPNLTKILEDEEPIALRENQKRPSIGILAFAARFLLQPR